jgi:glycogen debranching enzyme
VDASAESLSEALSIAAAGLMGNGIAVTDPSYGDGERYLLVAGPNQFKSLWARDFSMATAGALSIGMEREVHDSLDSLFSFQRGDGLMPRMVDNRGIDSRVILGLAGFHVPLKAPVKGWFKTENGVIAIDSNLVVPWAASEYILKTMDLDFARKWYHSAQRSLQFLTDGGFMVNGFVGNQPPFSDWEDSVRRGGRVAMTNVYYVLALRGMAAWAALVGEAGDALDYVLLADSTNRKFRDYFWRDDLGMLSNFEGDDRLTADANLMAVAHHLLSREDSLAVMAALRNSPLWRPMPGRPTWPDYPRSYKSFNVKLSGIASYHDSMTWLWITALAADAERAVGDCEAYHAILESLADLVVKYGAVHEVYDLKPAGLVPVKRLLYRAERPFTWSSAMFIEAAQGGCPQTER